MGPIPFSLLAQDLPGARSPLGPAHLEPPDLAPLATLLDDPQAVFAAAIMLGATVLYLAYHLIIAPASVRRLFPAATTTPDALTTRTAWLRRLLGAVLFGVVPALALASAPGGLARFGLNLDHAPLSLALALGTLAVIAPVLMLQVRKSAFLELYPEVRVPFTARVRALNLASWAAYLIGYELFFRGVLVLGLAPLIGALPALAVSVMGYVWVHLNKYPGEAIGSLVLGTGFGLVALHTGSILMPFLAHLLIASTSDELAARHLAARHSGSPAR